MKNTSLIKTLKDKKFYFESMYHLAILTHTEKENVLGIINNIESLISSKENI